MSSRFPSRLKSVVLGLMLVGGVVLFATAVFAQVSVDLPTSFAGFSSQDLKVTIANIVRIVLGFIGILFLLLVLYGGFVWMTSQGAPDKINRAKKIIASAVIGLLIVLSAYSIAGFIVKSLQQAVSPAPPSGPSVCGADGDADGSLIDPGEQCDDGNVTNGDGCSAFCNIEGAITGCPFPAVAGRVKVCSVTNPSYRSQIAVIKGYNFGPSATPGTVSINGVVVTPVACGTSNGWNGGSIVVDIPATVPLGTIGTENVVVTRFDSQTCVAEGCGITNVSIGSSPFIRCMTPNFGPSDGFQDVKLEGGNFGLVQGDIEMEGALASPANRFLVGAANIGPWTNEETHFRVPAATAPQQAISGDVVLIDSAAARSNGMPFAVTCTVPSNASAQCATGCCTNYLQCRPVAECLAATPGGPVITGINPNNGEEGNYVTVNGSNFLAFVAGTSVLHFYWPATNTFYDNHFPTNPQCTANWSDTQIILEIPDISAANNQNAPPLAAALVWVTTAVGDSNQVTFSVNDIVRPGLCKVTPASGLPNVPPPFHLDGVNLSGGVRNIFFGTPPGINATSPNYIDAQNAEATIPNLTAGISTIAFTTNASTPNAQNSNPLDFTVLGVAAGDPIINSINPFSGPSGTYVTIQGANFGPTIGKVYLSPVGHSGCGPGGIGPTGNECLADISFPPMCGNDFWRDDQIIVKIPKTGPPTNVPQGNYYFIVERAGLPLKRSLVTPIPGTNGIFDKDDALPVTPGLCRINPVGGPANYPVDYFGENFGTYVGGQSTIWFDKDAPVTSPVIWSNTQVIGAQVPASALTGTTTVQHANGERSNHLPFFVGSCTSDAQCGGSAICCTGICRVNSCTGGNHDENNWEFESGQYDFDLVRSQQCTENYQSPTPFPYDHVNMNYDGFFDPVILPVYDDINPVTNAPLKVAIAGRFTRPLDFNTVLGPDPNPLVVADNGIRIFKCNAASDIFNGAGCIEVTADGVFVKVGSSGFRWNMNAGGSLDAETWYEVRLDDGTGLPVSRVRAADTSFYKGSQFFGDDTGVLELDDFHWHFRTRTAAQGLCEISTVSLSPDTVAPVGGNSSAMTAVPSNAQCYICGGDYEYDWNPAPAGLLPYASYFPDNPPLVTADATQFTGIAITPAPIDITATLTNNPSGTPVTSNVAELTVAYTPPYVVSHSPEESCTTVCRNVAPYVTLNVDIDPTTVTAANISLRPCATSACLLAGLGAAVPITFKPLTTDPPTDRIDIYPPITGLAGATWYRVMITPGITNTQGQALTRLNFPVGAENSYSWKFQTSLALCEADALTVTPAATIIPSLGGTQNFIAHPTATVNCGSGPVGISINPNHYDYAWSSLDPLVATVPPAITISQATYTGICATCGAPLGTTFASVTMTNKPVNPIPPILFTATSQIVVRDSRDPMNFIGHRPDDIPHSPPENITPQCALSAGLADPLQCTGQCTNALVSAFFGTFVDPSSVSASNFYVSEVTSGTIVPGTLAVRNYVDSATGVCSITTTQLCSTVLPCAVTEFCNYKRGRIDFTPNLSGALSSAGLVAHYTFDDGTAKDVSGSGNNGVVYGNPQDPAPVSGSQCIENGCFDFDLGAYPANYTTTDIIRVPSFSKLPANQITVSAWMNERAFTAQGQRILAHDWAITNFPGCANGDKCDDGTTPAGACPVGTTACVYNHGWLMIAYQPGFVHFGVYGSPWNDQHSASFLAPVLSPNTWYHVVGTYDGTTVKVYVNGVLGSVTATTATPIVLDTTGAVDFGYAFDGLVDDVRVYNRVLSAGEVNQLGNEGGPKGLIARYSFDDGTASDVSGNGHDGTLVGGVSSAAAGTQIPTLGRSMNFNGTDGYITIPDHNDLDLSLNFSFSAWVNSPTAATQATVLSKDPGPPTNTEANGPYNMYTGSGLAYETNNLGSLATPAGLIGNDEWHHVMVTHTDIITRLYVDGIERAAADVTNPSVNTYNLLIGRRGLLAPNSFFNGKLDDIRIYNRSLSATEVNQVRLAGLGLSTPVGVFLPSTQYRVNVCQGGSCGTGPIKSTQGVLYNTPRTFAFQTGADMCRISYVEVIPNPAAFVDRRIQCLLPAGAPQCTLAVPKTITAQAKDQTGSDLTAVYTWRKTTEFAGPYSSQLYVLNQAGTDAAVQHKGVMGIDYNEVTADGGAAGSATAQGRMDFAFCENPWLGDTGLNTAYYLDATYDVMLSYCRDASGSDPSNPTSILPNLPAPHIERSGAAFIFGGDLLKEHVFIVGTGNTGGGPLVSSNPQITNAPLTSQVQPNYHIGDLVYIKVEARDPEGDSFLYKMTGEGSPDTLPASASFNPRTGVFIWVIDKMPTTNGDANPNNDFRIIFDTTPASTAAQTVYINVLPSTVPPPAVLPTTRFTSASVPVPPPAAIIEGGTMTINYGDKVVFNTDTTAAVRSFVWDFQDSGLTSYIDTTGPTFSAEHTFLQAGVHQVTFRIQDNANVWSLPAVVNIIVRPKTSALFQNDRPLRRVASRIPFRLFMTDFTSLFTRTAWGQSQGSAPSNLAALSIDDALTSNNLVNVQLSWTNNGAYTAIHVYRDGTLIAPAVAGDATTYLDTARIIGTDYSYRVCGMVGAQEKCVELMTTARRVDYDIIVARIYRNIGMLSVREWYETYAPNPTGSPKELLVDGYDAIQDGTSVYVGMANCVNPTGCTGNPGIYTNVMLLSYNEGAQQSTVDIFTQLVNTIKINSELVNLDTGAPSPDTCSADSTISCDPGHDAVCQAKNAGYCTSAKAELRRDHKRVVDLNSIRASLDNYAAQHHFCNDGSNTRACNTDNDCGNGILCVAAYPSLSSGSYLGGISTSQWPSWNETLATDLNSSILPKDPINRFGTNFYSAAPASCLTLADPPINSPGHDKDTCWNQRTLKMQCHRGSEVYVYQNKLGTNFKLYSNAEASLWRWANIDVAHIVLDDPSLGNLCLDNAPVVAICGNGLIERYCTGATTRSCVSDAECVGFGVCGGELCDGGFRNYCDLNFGEARWNTDFTVGCNATCSAWGDPYAPNTATTGRAACGGACGDGTAQTPSSVPSGPEQCDGTVPAAMHCTMAGNAYCSSTCQVACTQGRPYSGTCNNGVVEAGEICDDGNLLNGTPGHCNRSCSGYGSFCGDGTLIPTDVTDLGCVCDNAAPFPTCPAWTGPIKGVACSKACTASSPAHQYSCTKNNEECDTVIGLTNYSCPANTSLYCDNQCNRACTTITIDPTTGNRTSIAIYEHYYNSGNDEDHAYTNLKVADAPYTTKGIVFYADTWTGACPAARGWYRWYNKINKDEILRNTAISNATWQSSPQPEFCSYVPNPADQSIVPVYEWSYTSKTSLPSDTDYMYSRSSSTIPINGEGANYALNATALFWARLGPLQETCGNDVLEGLEECEPTTYQVPTAEQATNDNKQYQCGAVFTPNACRLYGGYCGDAVKNDPFEQCDEGSATPFKCSLAPFPNCTTDTDCTSTGVNYGTCIGNGAKCNNNAANCTYCTKSCSNGLIARNYCGDGIVNCGTDGICGNVNAADDLEDCDDGADNGKPLKCNETCTGLTGTICGRNGVERFCNNNSANPCATPADQASCTAGGGSCVGEFCDDGSNNGRWTNTCADNVTFCSTDAQCGGAPGSCGSGTPHAFCAFGCKGWQPPYCGDGVVQLPNAGPDGRLACSHDSSVPCTDDAAGDLLCGALQPGSTCNLDGVDEVCDLGVGVNGQPGQCNSTCTGLAPAQCGNGLIDNGRCSILITKACTSPADCTTAEGQCRGTGNCTLAPNKSCQDDSGCVLLTEGTCAGVETCDQPSGAPVQQTCSDSTVGGKPGLQMIGCNLCVSQSTQCHAFGLKIWSDGADVAYLNGRLMLLNLGPPGAQCINDPAANGADYADTVAESPPQPNSNKCVP